jgi:hypothetical protein
VRHLAARGAEVADAAVDDVNLRVALKVLDLPLELVRLDEVVGVEELEVFARRVADAGVARRPLPRVLLPDVADARVSGRVSLDDRARVVLRAVVHDDALPGAVGLRREARERLADEVPVVVGRDDDADQRA